MIRRRSHFASFWVSTLYEQNKAALSVVYFECNCTGILSTVALILFPVQMNPHCSIDGD